MPQPDKLHIRVAVDARPLDGTKNGYAAYTEWVVGALQASGCEVALLSSRPVVFSAYERIKKCDNPVFGGTRSVMWEQFDLRSYLAKHKYDVYFCGQNIGLPLFYRGQTRLVLGVLDMIPQRFSDHYIVTTRDKIRYRYIQRANVQKADQIVTISKASQRDIETYMNAQRVTSVYIRQTIHGQPGVRLKPSEHPSYVYIGGVEWRKRLDTVLEAFEMSLTTRPKSKLYLIGDGYEKVVEALSPQLRASIILSGVLSESKRNELMRSSDAVLFPSTYEGYGLPIAESLLLGVPIICGTGGSQKEIGGSSALYVDPAQATSVLKAMELALTPDFRRKFQKGLSQQIDFLTDPQLDQKLVNAVTEGL